MIANHGRGQAAHLPEQITHLIGDRAGAVVQQDKRSIAEVIRYHRPGGRTMFLKAQPLLPDRPLAREAANLRWCAGELPVAAVLGYAATTSAEFLLLDGADGVDGAKAVLRLPEDAITGIFIAAMLRWHATPPGSFSRQITAQDHIAGLIRDLEMPLRSPSLRDDARDLGTRLHRLRTGWPATRRHVLTHGDFSLPNVMVSGRQLTAYLDVADMAVGDPARDLAAAAISLRRNLDYAPDRAVAALLDAADADIELVERWTALIDVTLNVRRLLAASVTDRLAPACPGSRGVVAT